LALTNHEMLECYRNIALMYDNFQIRSLMQQITNQRRLIVICITYIWGLCILS